MERAASEIMLQMLIIIIVTCAIAITYFALKNSTLKRKIKAEEKAGALDISFSGDLRPLFQDLSRSDLVEYWKKVKETIHLFDDIIVRYVVQWCNVLLVMIGASLLAFTEPVPLPRADFTAGVISSFALLLMFPIVVKLYFYYDLLEKSLEVGEDIEKLVWGSSERAAKFGLTHRLAVKSTEPFLGITRFGWSVFSLLLSLP